MEPVKELCNDCLNRFSCIFDSGTVIKNCELYKSDSEAVQYIIDRLSEYLKNKKQVTGVQLNSDGTWTAIMTNTRHKHF